MPWVLPSLTTRVSVITEVLRCLLRCETLLQCASKTSVKTARPYKAAEPLQRVEIMQKRSLPHPCPTWWNHLKSVDDQISRRGPNETVTQQFEPFCVIQGKFAWLKIHTDASHFQFYINITGTFRQMDSLVFRVRLSQLTINKLKNMIRSSECKRRRAYLKMWKYFCLLQHVCCFWCWWCVLRVERRSV